LTLTGLADIGGEFLEVCVGFSERILALQFGAKCDLQKFGSREIALLQLLVKVFG
jgi:hypothetical protein